MNEAYFKARAALQARKAGRMGDYADYLKEQADGYAALAKSKEIQKVRDLAGDKLPKSLEWMREETAVHDLYRPEWQNTPSDGYTPCPTPGEPIIERLMRNDPGPGRAGRILHPRPGTPEFLEYAGVYGEPVIEVFTPNGAEGYTLTPLSGKTGKPITERGAKALQTKHQKMLAEKRGVIQPANESHVWKQK